MSMIPMPPGATLAITTTALALNVRLETRAHFDQVITFLTHARELFNGVGDVMGPTREEADEMAKEPWADPPPEVMPAYEPEPIEF